MHYPGIFLKPLGSFMGKRKGGGEDKRLEKNGNREIKSIKQQL
jgi:hypothetical protein